MTSSNSEIPLTRDWAEIELPDAWPDQIGWRQPRHLWRFALGMVFGRRRVVELPPQLPGAERLPRYLLQEFHHLPNGNYSKSVSRGYVSSFDRVMLGSMHQGRQQIAARLAGAARVLDVGCGGGQLAQALSASSPEVWAVEPSPYLLQHAARRVPGLRCVQGVIEKTEFPDQFFDAAGACFVFHEIPPRHADDALTELHRILKPGALLCLVEPSAQQLRQSFLQMARTHGWRGLYFRLLALRMFEPFVAAWQARDHAAWFAAHGFELVESEDLMPYQIFLARRRP